MAVLTSLTNRGNKRRDYIPWPAEHQQATKKKWIFSLKREFSESTSQHNDWLGEDKQPLGVDGGSNKPTKARRCSAEFNARWWCLQFEWVGSESLQKGDELVEGNRILNVAIWAPAVSCNERQTAETGRSVSCCVCTCRARVVNSGYLPDPAFLSEWMIWAVNQLCERTRPPVHTLGWSGWWRCLVHGPILPRPLSSLKQSTSEINEGCGFLSFCFFI